MYAASLTLNETLSLTNWANMHSQSLWFIYFAVAIGVLVTVTSLKFTHRAIRIFVKITFVIGFGWFAFFSFNAINEVWQNQRFLEDRAYHLKDKVYNMNSDKDLFHNDFANWAVWRLHWIPDLVMIILILLAPDAKSTQPVIREVVTEAA